MEHVRAVGVSAFGGTQQTAYATANALPAVQAFLAPVGVTQIRQFWATENAPSAGSLAGLQSTCQCCRLLGRADVRAAAVSELHAASGLDRVQRR